MSETCGYCFVSLAQILAEIRIGSDFQAQTIVCRYVDALFKRANDVTHVTGIKVGEDTKVKFTEEEELAFAALAEESRLRRLTPEQREEEEIQKRKEEEEDEMSSSDDDDDDYTDEEQAAEWIDAHEDFKRVASEEAEGEALSEERGVCVCVHDNDNVKEEGGEVRLYTKKVEEERKRLREAYHIKRVEEREALRSEKRYEILKTTQCHTKQHNAISCHAMPCHRRIY